MKKLLAVLAAFIGIAPLLVSANTMTLDYVQMRNGNRNWLTPGEQAFIYGDSFGGNELSVQFSDNPNAPDRSYPVSDSGNFVVPNLPEGDYDLVAANNEGTSNNITVHIASLSVSSGRPIISRTSPTAARPGDRVTVYGENFDAATFLAIDGGNSSTLQPASLTVSSPTTLSFKLPKSIAVGNHGISVAQKAGPWDLSTPIMFTVIADDDTQNSGSNNSGANLVTSSNFVTFNYTQGDSAPQPVSLNLFNQSSSKPITFRISVPNQPSWLNAGYNTSELTLGTGQTMGLGVSVDPSKLGTGTYAYQIKLIGNFANSPLNIAVTLNVNSGSTTLLPVSHPIPTITSSGNSMSSADRLILIQQIQTLLAALIEQLKEAIASGR